MIASLSLILLCQLAGEVFVRGLSLPMPGPVVGLMLLLLLLLARDRFAVLARGPLQGGGVENASRGLLAHLSLLFVPAGVGVVQKLDLIAEHGIAIVAVLAVSVVVTLLVTVATFLLASRLMARGTGRAMSENPFSLWVYLSQSPLLWLTVTLLTYASPTPYRWRRTGIRWPIPCCIRCGSSAHSCCSPAPPTPPISAARSSCTSCSGRRPWRWPCRSTKTARWRSRRSCRCWRRSWSAR